MKRFVHISDLHIEDQGKIIWDTNTKDHFDRAIKKLRSLEGIDSIIVSGDLSNDGSLWSYQYIDKSFASLGIPTFCCPGNHDDLNAFYHGYAPQWYKTDPMFKLGKWTFIMLNTAVPNMSRGYFEPEILRRELQFASEPAIVVLHHPPIEQEGWLNRKLLENRNEFNDIVRESGKVKLVLYGHTHCHTNQNVNDVVYSSAPSTGFAFNSNLQKFEIAHGEEGFSLITLEDNNSIKIENILLNDESCER